MADDADPATEPDRRNAFRHYWEVMWAWLGKPVVQQRSVYLLIIIFMFYLPLPYFGRVVQDWFWDRGLFFDPKHEGAIIVESPQLFTRERLINQRLADSRWIDERIDAVSDMITANRFGLPDQLREDFLKQRLELGGSQVENKDTVAAHAQDATLNAALNLNVGPHLEFQDAHEYRQFLVQKKYEYVLDDIHDTHSNTLHRLNFNLFVSPSRAYSSSIAAVSVRLQQPSDPQWLLHKYGALLLDIREELSETAQKLIQDRATILTQDSNIGFPAEVDKLLRREITRLAQGSELIAAEFIEDTSDLLSRDMMDRASAELTRQITEMAPGTNIGPILFRYFSDEKQASPQQHASDKKIVRQTASAQVETGNQSKKNDSQGRSAKPQMGVLRMNRALNRLSSQCGQHVSLIQLMPPNFFNGSPIYTALKQEVRSRWDIFPEKAGALNHANVDRMAREVLYNVPVNAPCMVPKRIGSTAMLSALGYLTMTEVEEHKGKVPEWAVLCFKRPENITQSEMQNLPKDLAPNFTLLCQGMRQNMINVGVVHLVKAELENTPIDTVGRVRQLDDYFHLDTRDCDIRNCQIAVMTTAEQQREDLALERLKYEREESPSQRDLEARKRLDKEKVQSTGNNEALRLFAELACFSNARSYAVYPRKGAGQNVQHTQIEQRTLWSWFGGSSLSLSNGSKQSERSRRNSIFGIGDSGDDQRDKELECGPSFLHILNNLEPTDDVVGRIHQSINDGDKGLDPRWIAIARCLLRAEVESRGPNDLQEARQACQEEKPSTYQTVPEFNIFHLTSAVRHLRQRETTVSWIARPLDTHGRGKRHELKNEPLSALVSIPSWWPGVEVVIETCWVRHRWIGNDTSKGLCQDTPEPKTGELLTVFDNHIKRAKARGRIASSQVLPLPHDLDDVLPKLGFFIVRYPYLDNFEANTVSLETGRKVQLRLTGKRLWKNPRVRLGEQWHDEVQVLPDMQGILATFKCLDPIRRPGRKMVDERHLQSGDDQDGKPEDDMLFWAQTRPDPNADELYTELRQVQVWTSEGATNPANLQVSSFRPVDTDPALNDQPCWRIGTPLKDED